ncbi:preprotein translocase subunit SecG [Candidatus Berkelbacteria bacterium]|nr:preprotein translocase subunit SecG [Candidatus Berkelbacteria bacterium]
MKEIIQSVEIIVAVLLMTVILLQQRGTGLGGAFGSEGFAFRSRRGIEQFFFRSTIFLAALFVGLAVALLVVIRS